MEELKSKLLLESNRREIFERKSAELEIINDGLRTENEVALWFNGLHIRYLVSQLRQLTPTHCSYKQTISKRTSGSVQLQRPEMFIYL